MLLIYHGSKNDSIRNNILFSLPFDEVKQNRVISLCQINQDLETYEGKDLTEIGEKGINFSGGKKVNISVARTIYNEPDIYLFEDPISALYANAKKNNEELHSEIFKRKNKSSSYTCFERFKIYRYYYLYEIGKNLIKWKLV